MAIGFVFISAVPGKEHNVYEKLNTIKKIKELYAISGDHDFLVKIETEDFVELGNLIIKEIRTIDGVKATRTVEGMKL